MVTAPAKRELVRWMETRGLSERRCLGVVRMSESALRYEPRADRNVALRAQSAALANEVWSMDFVFDRVATGRTLKCLTVVDDATHEVIAVPVEH